jgi:DNA-binding winged helix-turn-helix (wHTH) protein/TolB-like protein/Flp pilus assembly protein TadD
MNNNGHHLRIFGQFMLDTEKRVLWCDGQPVKLAYKQVELLCVLTESAGEVITKQELLNRLWAESFVEESNLSRHVYVLRKTLKDLGAEDLIETVPRRGYRFTGEMGPSEQLIIERRAVMTTRIDIDPETASVPTRLTTSRLVVIAAVLLVLTMAAGIVGWRKESVSERSIAILPFNTLNDGSDTAGLGITDMLITRLSKISELRVRPTSSVLGLTGDSLENGKRLGVDVVLEGTILRTSDNIRVTARLLRTADGSSVWAGQFDKPLIEELALQNEIAVQIASALRLSLNTSQRNELVKRYTDSPEAYQLYVKGRYLWSRRNRQNMLDAEQAFRSALEKDPNFALAHVGLADTMVMRELTPGVTTRALDSALELDPNTGEAHATLGFINMFHEWQWDKAGAAFVLANELSPGYATAHHWHATLLAIEGRFDQAKLEMHRALDIDPSSPLYLADLGQIHYFAEEYDQAEAYCQQAIAIDPGFGNAHRYLHDVYLIKGETEKAVAEWTRFMFCEDPAAKTEDLGGAIAKIKDELHSKGRGKYLLDTLVQAPSHPNYNYFNAKVYTLVGEKEKALTNLELAYAGRAFLSAFVKAEPIFAPLRDEPRYRNIISSMNLPD